MNDFLMLWGVLVIVAPNLAGDLSALLPDPPLDLYPSIGAWQGISLLQLFLMRIRNVL